MLVLNIFVFVPFGIYQGNLDEFEIGFVQMLLSHWEMIILSWLVLLSPLVSASRFVRIYGVLIFVLACFTWLQSTLLMWDYGVFDGRGMNFQPFHMFGGLDLLILFILVLGAFRFAPRIEPLVNTIAWVFIVGQLGLMWNNATGREDIWERALPRLEIPQAFGSLSREQNIFHFIFDSAQSDVFLELIDEADLREEFGGFTLFVENAAVAPHTAFGVPSTFSGKLFDGSQSPEKYFRAAIENGFHNQLLKAGYSVNLIPLLSMEKGPYTNYFEIPSGYRGVTEDLVRANTAKLMDTALFRVSPHFLRIEVYDDGNWLLSAINRTENDVRSFRERAFFKDYIDKLNVTQDGPAYHFVHLMPPHPPYVTLADGTYAGEVLPNTRENFSNEMRPMIDLVTQLLERLKSLGVYDNAAIIIQGDHGSSVSPVIDGSAIEPCLPRLAALLAVKTPMKNEPLAVSNSMTSLLDIAPTILNLAGQDTSSVFHLDPSTERRRPYFLYNDNRITKYWIDGSVFDANSCKEAGVRDIEIVREVYEMGSRIDFGMQGNADGVVDYGWGPQLNGHSWSKAKKAALQIHIAEKYLNTDLDLELRFSPFINHEKLPRQRISVSVNGILVSQWVEQTRKVRKRRIRIPANAVDRSELSVVFEFPDAASPKSLGLGADGKQLGIALLSIQLGVAKSGE